MPNYGEGNYGEGVYSDSVVVITPPPDGSYGSNTYGTGTYDGQLAVIPQPVGSGYTGRLGHPFARLTWVVLGFNLPTVPVHRPIPRPDMMTLVELGRATALVLGVRSTSDEIGERVTSVYPDQ